MICLPHDHEHHGAGHRHFDPEFFLATEEMRRTLLAPEEALADFLASDDETLADIGAGAGFFALPAARRLRRGRVYAIDRQEDMLEIVRRRSREDGLQNIIPLRAEAKAIPLEDGAVDAALMANVYHDIEDREAALREVARIVRPGGAFYLVEWDSSDLEKGPPSELRINAPDLERALEEGGFRVERRLDGPSPFYRVLARRP